MEQINHALVAFANFVWGTPILILLLGGGGFFVLYSRLLPYRHFRHAFHIIRGAYDDPRESGDITHFQALSGALAGTIGLGNIAGVAVAIHVGGPGAMFWMWMSALVGVCTKFFTCTLSIMYRGRDSRGALQGGPMYVVTEGLGPRWRPLAILFAVAGLFGTLPVFQVNQLTQIMRDVVAVPNGWASHGHFDFDLLFGLATAAMVALVLFGGIRRVGAVASRLVPLMVAGYGLMTLYVLVAYRAEIPASLALIVHDALTGQAAAGGVLGAVILTGVRRGAFSNEAGIGTEAMAHGAARTDEPVREGLVAMVGPVIDTLVVCTCTALAILVTGVWRGADANGVTLTAHAFERAMPGMGAYLLTVMVFVLSISTMFTYGYYGAKCTNFLLGAERQHYHRYLYVALIVVGAVASLEAVISLIDGMYALMAIPTMVSAIVLAPRVMRAAEDYFERHGLAGSRRRPAELSRQREGNPD